MDLAECEFAEGWGEEGGEDGERSGKDGGGLHFGFGNSDDVDELFGGRSLWRELGMEKLSSSWSLGRKKESNIYMYCRFDSGDRHRYLIPRSYSSPHPIDRGVLLFGAGGSHNQDRSEDHGLYEKCGA